MNILLINHYAGSPEMGMEFRPYYFAREWVSQGNNVHIIASSYSHLRKNNPEVNKDWEIKKIDGIYYHWVNAGEYHGNGAARAVSMEEFVRKIIMKAQDIIRIVEPDVIICSSTYPLDTYAGQRLKKIAKKTTGKEVKLVHEVHDMWPATLTEIGGMSKTHPFVIGMQMGENSAYKHSDMVVAMMPRAEEYIRSHGFKKSKYIHIPLGIDLQEWENRQALNEECKSEIDKIKGRYDFILGYFGGHALSNALDILLDAAKLSQDRGESIGFVLVGDGVEKEGLVEKANNLKLENMVFLPPVGKKEIPELLNQFDGIYIGTMKSKLYEDFGLCMNKMADAMMGGRPIVCATDAPATWVEEAGCGIMVPAEDTVGIIDAVIRLKNMPQDDRNEMGERGRDYCINNLDVKIVANKMLKAMEEL